jgi:hypothetical protein
VDGFYVHPGTGLLCRAWPESSRERKRQHLLAEEVTWLASDHETGYRKHKGIWYRVKYKRVFAGWYRSTPLMVYDIFYKQEVPLKQGWYVVATEKKQCNRDELKRVQYLLWERSWRIRNV